MRKVALLGILLFSLNVIGSDLSELPKNALEKSQLTLPGSKPFHLKAITYEKTNEANEGYKAEIEEWWAAPDRWKRVIRSKEFTSTHIVNGDKHSETFTDNYEPLWLQSFVDAVFDPGKHMQNVDLSKSTDNPVSGGDQTCRRFSYHVGIAPVHNRIFASYCFRKGLISSILTPDFSADYFDYKKFGDKQVARRLESYVKPGEEAGAKIVELSELKDESGIFDAPPSPEFTIVTVSEQNLRSMGPENQQIQWPTGKGGKSSGSLTILVILDFDGKVREIRELNSDNPNMTDAAIDQVTQWHFKRATSHGNPAQIQGLLTFQFDVAPSQDKGKQ